ncbi:MAG: hypothetical protein Q7S22_04725 [Candidatus Micrarchaeota archaeon]|nr:hypothetical protein [Candidatus Micrarchaeota archaeon]
MNETEILKRKIGWVILGFFVFAFVSGIRWGNTMIPSLSTDTLSILWIGGLVIGILSYWYYDKTLKEMDGQTGSHTGYR